MIFPQFKSLPQSAPTPARSPDSAATRAPTRAAANFSTLAHGVLTVKLGASSVISTLHLELLGCQTTVRRCRYTASNSDLHRAAQRGGMLHLQGHGCRKHCHPTRGPVMECVPRKLNVGRIPRKARGAGSQKGNATTQRAVRLWNLMGWSAPFHSHGLEGQNGRGFTQRSRP